jgi:uncharacterized damage-inducible protein DinB
MAAAIDAMSRTRRRTGGAMTRAGFESQAVLLALIDEAFDRRSWHGTTLLGSVRGISADAAARRPALGRHNIWEIVVHAAYWKYAVRRRLLGGTRGRFALDGSNWFTRPAGGITEAAWRADVRLLGDEHARLRAAIADLPAARLTGGQRGQGPAFLIRGIAAHDLYHAGQIQLLKRLVTAARPHGRRRPRPGAR